MNSDPDRAAARLAWTRTVLGQASLVLEPASADASFRSYWRTQHAGRSWIVMDSPPAQEDPRPWLAIGTRLHDAGLHVPAVHAQDLQQGFLLIEDLGSGLYLAELNDATADALYGDALAALFRMQGAVDASDLPPYDEAFLRRELELMPEWFLGRHLDCAPDEADRAAMAAAFAVITQSALEQPRCFVHRDYHARNLLVVPPAGESPPGAGAPLSNPGIIDFQGALLGPLSYDLASLLRDCYIAWDDARVYGWVEDYRRQLQQAGLIDAQVDAVRFRRWFDLVGLQRHLKVLGIFCRLWYRDGKRHYLDDLPLVYRYVMEVTRSYPELAALAALLERCVGSRDLTVPAP